MSDGNEAPRATGSVSGRVTARAFGGDAGSHQTLPLIEPLKDPRNLTSVIRPSIVGHRDSPRPVVQVMRLRPGLEPRGLATRRAAQRARREAQVAAGARH